MSKNPSQTNQVHEETQESGAKVGGPTPSQGTTPTPETPGSQGSKSTLEYLKETIERNWGKILQVVAKGGSDYDRDVATEMAAMLKTIFKYSLWWKLKIHAGDVEIIMKQGWEASDVTDVDVITVERWVRFNYPNNQFFTVAVDLSTDDLSKEQYQYFERMKTALRVANELMSG